MLKVKRTQPKEIKEPSTDEKIEQLERDKVNLQLTLAQLIEQVTLKG